MNLSFGANLMICIPATTGTQTVYLRGKAFSAHCQMDESPPGTYIDGTGHNFWHRTSWGVKPTQELTKNWQKVQISMQKCMTVVKKTQLNHFTWSVDPGTSQSGHFRSGMGLSQI